MPLRTFRKTSLPLVAAALLTSILVTNKARAQQAGSFALDQFQAAPSGDRFFAVQDYMAGSGKVDFSGMVLGEYAHNPLVLYNLGPDGKTSDHVPNQSILPQLPSTPCPAITRASTISSNRFASIHPDRSAASRSVSPSSWALCAIAEALS